MRWLEVGDPGNPAWEDDRYPHARFYGRGRVDHRYSMSETEVTVQQWIRFVRAYGEFADEPYESDLLGNWIWGREGDDGKPEYGYFPGRARYPAEMSWRMAARFCNWMHNGRVNEAWAFESGAYDTSTFVDYDDPPPENGDQTTRSPGARYWIPSMDEWMKGMYYDPDIDGQGNGGWWGHPNSTNDPLIAALPEDGGETNAGLLDTYGWGAHLRAGMYPDSASPWGLLDGSGGVREFTEEWNDPEWKDRRLVRGSEFLSFLHEHDDFLADSGRSKDPDQWILVGFRAATSVPSVPSALVLGPALLSLVVRRDRS